MVDRLDGMGVILGDKVERLEIVPESGGLGLVGLLQWDLKEDDHEQKKAKQGKDEDKMAEEE